MAKEKKQRPDHYEPKLIVKEHVKFIDVINASLGVKTQPKASKPAKKSAGKKG